MSKIEVPTSVRLYVQWILHPFPNPKVPQQENENSKWALVKTKSLIEGISIDENCVMAVVKNGLIMLEIKQPIILVEDGKEMWDYVLSSLKKSNNIVSISIFVNNDISEMIATNFADRVPRPWHKGYQGFGSSTLIYHK